MHGAQVLESRLGIANLAIGQTKAEKRVIEIRPESYRPCKGGTHFGKAQPSVFSLLGKAIANLRIGNAVIESAPPFPPGFG